MTRSAKTATIFCPVCKADTLQSVSDSRPTTFDGFAVVRRRRICEDCGGKFSTIELPTAFLDDRLLRAEILKRIFDKVYDELTSGAPKLDRRYNMLKGDGD